MNKTVRIFFLVFLSLQATSNEGLWAIESVEGTPDELIMPKAKETSVDEAPVSLQEMLEAPNAKKFNPWNNTIFAWVERIGNIRRSVIIDFEEDKPVSCDHTVIKEVDGALVASTFMRGFEEGETVCDECAGAVEKCNLFAILNDYTIV